MKRRHVLLVIGVACVLAMPLTAYLGVYPDAVKLQWSPAPGPVEWYQACVRGPGDEMCGRAPQAWELVVRACRQPTPDDPTECGPWSEPRGIIAVPEPGFLLLLAAGLGLGALNWLRASRPD